MNPCPTQPSPITPSRRFPATAGLRLNCSNEFALLADKVHEVITLRTDQVLDWQGSATGVGRQFVRGVTEGALIVLDGAALLQDDRLFIDQGGDGAGV